MPTHKLGLADMPLDVNLQILEELPDVSSLKNAVLAVDSLHRALTARPKSISTQVLRNELPENIWEHAIVSQMLSNGRVETPDLDGIEVADIASYVDAVRVLRDTAPQTRVSPPDALAISRFYCKVSELRALFIEDCAYSQKQQFDPLWKSIHHRPPMLSELNRIEQALYLFQILTRLCKKMTFSETVESGYAARCREKVAELQRCLVMRLMAPWELYQVIAIECYFWRATHGLEGPADIADRFMPDILASGLDLMHEALCLVGGPNVAEFIAPFEERALSRPFHAFSAIVSRGFSKAWTRMKPRRFSTYTSFAADKDKLGYRSWVRVEKEQLKLVGNHQIWTDLLWDRLEALEERLDLWAAALWDACRWPEILVTVQRPEPRLWQGMKHRWSSIRMVFIFVADPWTIKEAFDDAEKEKLDAQLGRSRRI
ncbi:hypothetical protein HRG_004340 [Hirsutella rhossiliensis]|uniref:Uncharacterized protein n=1 Tax=Hirsutella rhossiliensis TaxID=111463 RepID=A0A9P8N394_9HYPO|nr:uncharacterized protein HRG_04340 [Hirsutella rhossiliensis]KAH0963912.1 hypothetical protein HRG_04340 [Hirsutella rhossiliensis]